MQKSLVEQHMSRCVYFNGIAHAQCEAGVEYESVKSTAPEGFWRRFWLPCFVDEGGACAHRRFPTREEAEARERESDEYLGFVLRARRAITEKHGANSPPLDIHDTIACPKCGKALRYRIASYNGHVWGRCDTGGCLAWME